MRILLVNIEYPPLGGGGANATKYLVRQLVQRGHTVDVLTSLYPGLKRYEVIDGAKIYRIPVKRARMYFCSVREMLTFVTNSIIPALRLASKEKYDVVHTFFTVPCGHIGWLLKRTHGLPYVISARGGDVPGFKPHGYDKHYKRATPFIKALWRDANAVVAVSQGLRDQMYKVGAGAEDIEYIPNGVDMNEFAPGEGSRDGKVHILCVTRLIHRKGIDYLLDAIKLVRERTSAPIHLDLVGTGVYQPTLQRRVQELAIEDVVTFHGAKQHDELPAIYQAADIFCLPSLAEGMANVLLEAQASGLPLVATHVGGSLELVHPEVNGYLVPKADPAALSEKLLQLIDNKQLRKEFGVKSRQLAKSFAWESVAAQYEEIYERIRNNTKS